MKQMIQCLLSENKRLKKKLNKYQVPNNFSITEKQQLRALLMGDSDEVAEKEHFEHLFMDEALSKAMFEPSEDEVKKHKYFQLIREYERNASPKMLEEMVKYAEDNFTSEERVKYNEEYYGIQQ